VSHDTAALPAKLGKVWLVGAGPGDPELLTRKAERVLRSADVVLYDRLVSAAVLELANTAAEFVYAGKGQGQQEPVQSEIFRLLVDYAARGLQVVRLKSGDPFVFGRGGEEMAWCREHGVDCEAVPGVSSAISVPAAAGIPVTWRGVSSSFTVVTGHARKEGAVDWASHAAAETLVILMGVETRRAIAAALIAAGRAASQPVAFIEQGTTPSQHVVETTLGEVARGAVAVSAPAIFVAGEVVRLRERLTEVNEHVAAIA
jgi:uroporphyrin-III C-methyltransferase